MLVLSRNVGTSLMVGDSVQVKVISVDGKTVRIGIEAPQEVPVHREEIYDRIRQGEPVKTKQLEEEH